MLHKVITLANFKGGVGKSTSTAAIGACLAMKGYKVLLVDLDGQSNLTLYYVPNADIMEDSIFDTLVSGKAIPIINVKPNLDIVPSSLEMSSAEIAMTRFKLHSYRKIKNAIYLSLCLFCLLRFTKIIIP